MDADCLTAGGADQGCCQTQLQRQQSLPHGCSHRCVVLHQFGNVYKCQSSGLLHICDVTCDKRVYRDRWSSICLLSGRIHAPLQQPAPLEHRKRSSCGHEESDVAKRVALSFGSQEQVMEA